MSNNDTAYFVNEYSTILQALLQQSESALRPFVMTGTHTGNGAQVVDQYGAVAMQQPTGRNAPIVPLDSTADSRWVFPNDRELPLAINNFDKLRMLIDPQSEYMKNAARAAHRQYDDFIVSAFFGTAYTGVGGATATTFPSANQVSVNLGGTASGLNIDKLLRAKRLLASYHVDPSEEIYCAVSAVQAENMLKQVQFTSGDFNPGKPLMDGKVTRFIGINFVPCERLQTDASGYRRVPVWVKSGIHLGMWGGDFKTDISQRKDLSSQPWQIYTTLTAGATRLEENRVIELPCAE